MCPNENNSFDGTDLAEIISLEKASAISGLSHGHLALLIRRGLLWGKKIGRNWVTTEEAVKEYLAKNPRPGRKKKIKNH